jgi:prevent-host-death family protein
VILLRYKLAPVREEIGNTLIIKKIDVHNKSFIIQRMMKTINFTKFRKKASGLITEVEKGEELVLIRHGKPVAEIIPYRKPEKSGPRWKQPITPLEIDGHDLSTAILEDRKVNK